MCKLPITKKQLRVKYFLVMETTVFISCIKDTYMQTLHTNNLRYHHKKLCQLDINYSISKGPTSFRTAAELFSTFLSSLSLSIGRLRLTLWLQLYHCGVS